MKELTKNKGENVRDYAYRVILHNIVTLELPPGSTVSENELSEQLKVSRTPVREALLEMRRLGLVEAFPQKGSYVTKIDYNMIDDANFIRLSLENAIVRLACQVGISSRYLKKLHDNLEQQRKYEPLEDAYAILLELDNAFHRLLFEAVDKNQAGDFLQPQMLHLDRLRNLAFRTLKVSKFNRTVDDHANILYAVEKRDEELAEMVMTKHLTRHLYEKRSYGICTRIISNSHSKKSSRRNVLYASLQGFSLIIILCSGNRWYAVPSGSGSPLPECPLPRYSLPP